MIEDAALLAAIKAEIRAQIYTLKPIPAAVNIGTTYNPVFRVNLGTDAQPFYILVYKDGTMSFGGGSAIPVGAVFTGAIGSPDRWSVFDGRLNAPAGASQLPNLLNIYKPSLIVAGRYFLGTGGGYQPPWHVAGVDYAVGISNAVTLVTPAANNLPAGASISGNTVQITGANVTLGTATTGYAFPTDWTIVVTSGASGTITIQNCQIVMNTVAVRGIDKTGNANLTVLNCDINGSQYSASSSVNTACAISFAGNGNFIAKYNYIHGMPVDSFQCQAGTHTVDLRFNMINGMGYTAGGSGGHPDSLQMLFGTVNGGIFAFNTVFCPSGSELQPNEVLDCEASGGGQQNNIVFANNTLISGGPGSVTTNSLITGSFVDDTSSTMNNFSFIYNFVDPTGSQFGIYGTPAQFAVTTGSHALCEGNIQLTDGTSQNIASCGNVPAGSTTSTTVALSSDIFSAVANPSSGNVVAGNSIVFTLTCARVMTVSSIPALTLNNGATASFTSGSGTSSLVFTYLVGSGDTATNNLAITGVTLTGSSIQDLFGNNTIMTGANTTFSGLSIGEPATLWPSAAIRPAFNVGTNVLTWTGPSVSGNNVAGPTTSSDVQQTLTLTVSGSVSSSAAGQVFVGLNIATGNNNAAITINHDSCRILRCRTQCAGTNFPSCPIVLGAGGTNCIIEDCLVDANAQSDSVSIAATIISTSQLANTVANLIVRRCNIQRGAKGIGTAHNGNLYIDNWFNNYIGTDNDMIQVYTNTATLGNYNTTVRHNTFDGTNDQFSTSFQDSCLNISTFDQPVPNTGWIFDNNACLLYNTTNPPTHQLVLAPDYTVGGSLSIAITNNGFYGSTPYNRASGNITYTANSGNFIMVNKTDTTGAPTNGTGAV